MSQIKDYFLIGDLHSAALVSKEGSIDWLCLPHFDSASVFAKMLDKNAGSFTIEAQNYTASTGYLKDTAVVKHSFQNKNSEFEVFDLMLPQPIKTCTNHFLLRRFKAAKGSSEIKLFFNPKPDFAKGKPQAEYDKKSRQLKLQIKHDLLILHLGKSSILQKKGQGFEIVVTLKEGEEVSFVLEYINGKKKSKYNGQDLLKQTLKFWQSWVKKGNFFDFCRDELVRSAVTLKLMQYYPTGAIIAAPTTSLPEKIGGVRNWDYRFVWIRDATFTLYALYVLHYQEEAEKFFEFIEKIAKEYEEEDFDISPMYTIEGKPVQKEKILSHFKGFRNSSPVRIGNNASAQFQLDVYGALIDAFYFVSKRKIWKRKLNKKLILNLVKKIGQVWQKKDSGIWEFRDKRYHFTYSKVMAWVGADRAVRLANKIGLNEKEKLQCQTLAKDIADWIFKNCFLPRKNRLKQHSQTNLQDATNLLFVLLQFLNKYDKRTEKIIHETCRELCFRDVFVYRYLTSDELPLGEGAFILCSFWLISALAILEKTDEASHLFQKLEDFIAEHGLISEEIDPQTGEYLGNYPQAFSHLGYILSAYYLHKYMSRRKS